MALPLDEIKKLIKEGIPDAKIEIKVAWYFKRSTKMKKIDKLVIVPKKPTIKNREYIIFENILFYNQLKINFGTYIK